MKRVYGAVVESDNAFLCARDGVVFLHDTDGFLLALPHDTAELLSAVSARGRLYIRWSFELEAPCDQS